MFSCCPRGDGRTRDVRWELVERAQVYPLQRRPCFTIVQFCRPILNVLSLSTFITATTAIDE